MDDIEFWVVRSVVVVYELLRHQVIAIEKVAICTHPYRLVFIFCKGINVMNLLSARHYVSEGAALVGYRVHQRQSAQ